MKRLENKVAIVTGSTSGIGRATAELFAEEGAKVILAGRREELGKEIIGKIKNKNGEATFVKTDVTKMDDLKNLVNSTVEKYGRIDVLVNNAGADAELSFVDMDEAFFDKIFTTNVKSYFFLTQMVIPYMLKQGKGSIVNTASISAEVGLPFHSAYSASKGAVRQLTKALAAEYATSGIRVNAVLPGLTNTGMVPAGSEFEKIAVQHVPMGRAAAPREIANGLLFMASDDSSFCTGCQLAVDGGETSV